MAPHQPPVARGFDLVEFATRRRVTIAMMTLTLVLFGLISLSSLKVELLPDLSYPTLTVRTDYEGAAPAEVETLISQPAEEALGIVKGLRRLRSVSRTGQSDVVLEFAWGTDMQQAGLDVRDKMETLQLPLDAKPPVLLRFNPSTQPITRLALQYFLLVAHPSLPARSAPTQVKSCPRRAASSADAAALARPAAAMLMAAARESTTPCLLIILISTGSVTFIQWLQRPPAHRLNRLNSRLAGLWIALIGVQKVYLAEIVR